MAGLRCLLFLKQVMLFSKGFFNKNAAVEQHCMDNKLEDKKVETYLNLLTLVKKLKKMVSIFPVTFLRSIYFIVKYNISNDQSNWVLV